MTSPAVQTRSTSAVTTAGTSHSVTLPSSIAAGDLLIVVFGFAVTGQTITWPGSWQAIPNFKIENTGGNTYGIDAGWLSAAGGETSITVGTSVSTKSAHCCYRITGHNTSTPVSSQAGATGATQNADPPSATVTGGPLDILAIACAGQTNEQAFTGYPTNYVNGQTADTGVGGATNTNGDTAAAELAISAASSENPGTFTYGVSSEWAANTIIVYPAAGGGGGATPQFFPVLVGV